MIYKNIFLIFTFSLFLILSACVSTYDYFIQAQSGSWATDDKDILNLRDSREYSVAHYLFD